MITFDDLTLAEVEEISNTAMGGKSFGDPTADPMLLAGAVLWMARRREQPGLQWQDFKATVSMRDIKEFSTSMQEIEANPLVNLNGSRS
jgi:hypothetical protein